MPRQSKNTFSVENNTIFINREGWDGLAMATYRDDYVEEVCNATWRLDGGGYPTNSRLGTLHSYMVKKWYGEEYYNEMRKNSFVVEHMNNNHMDSRISNLTFLLKRYNTAKGQTLDIDMREMRPHLAITMYRDFDTGCYQISIGCNDSISIKSSDGKGTMVCGIWLLYLPQTDYRLVMLDAQTILTEYQSTGMIELTHCHHCKIRKEVAKPIQLSPEEADADFVQRDGEIYMICRPGRIWVNSLHMQEGWLSDSGCDEIK